VPPWMKLPGFYLFDAISKNLYDTHAAAFASVVVPLYLDTYFQVDGNTRNKMEEMLLTWRTAAPDHVELFGPSAQLALQAAVWGDQSVASKGQVLAELQFTLGQMERALQSNPQDRTPQNHITVLQQLRKLVERGVSPEELRQILVQLRNLAKSVLPPPIVRPPPRPPVGPFYTPQPPFPPQLAQVPPPRPYSQPGPSIKTEVAPTPIQQHPILPVGPAAANLADLFSTLVNAGLLPPGGTPSTSTPSSVAKPEASSTETDDTLESKESALRDYRNRILSAPISLNTTDLARAKPRIVEILYDQQGAQCRQCGVRFSETKLGKKSLENHLDMHFRQNSKVDQGRGHSRSWYIGLEDWIQDISGDGKGKGRADGSGPLNAKAAAVVENAKRDADLRAQYVVVPPGAEAQVVSCPICKETLKSEFLEDDEDWVWKNAVKKDDKIYHATCHAEALVSTNTLAARLRNEKTQGSRSATPEVHPMVGIQASLRSTPPPSTHLSVSGSRSNRSTPESKVAGTKRKVEHEDSSLPQEANGTPPLKKKALSTEANS